MNLHPFQLVALSTILKTLFTEFSSQVGDLLLYINQNCIEQEN